MSTAYRRGYIADTVAWGIVGTVIGIVIGIVVANYCPIFGDPISMHLARPWSPVRRNYEPGHILVFALPLALLFGWVRHDAGKMTSPADVKLDVPRVEPGA